VSPTAGSAEGEAPPSHWFSPLRPATSSDRDAALFHNALAAASGALLASDGAPEAIARPALGASVCVSGFFTWRLARLPESARSWSSHASWREGSRGREHVAGVFCPATHRLALVGTHLDERARHLCSLDRYELLLAADGLSFTGLSMGELGEGMWSSAAKWGHALAGEATAALPRGDARRRMWSVRSP